MEYLGSHFDIHTGGVDHIPLHHTNEIAQSQAYLADHQPWVAWWLHGEFINLRGAKISKSTGGSVLVEDLLDRGYHPLVYRHLLLQSHYRQQTEFSWDAMNAARAGLRRLIDRFAAARSAPGELGPAALSHLEAFDQAVCDDLNTSAALAAVSAASRDDRLTQAELAGLGAEFDSVLGIGLALSVSDLDIKRADVTVNDKEIDVLITQRNEARAEKNFTRSDELRNQLVSLGIIIEDRPDGSSTWRWS
jgi:cysteinyl-tRNA synthetase